MPAEALLTDLYQLTMAYGYWRLGLAERRATFHLFFRRAPFKGGYAIAAGLGPAVELVQAVRFDADDVAFLGTLTGTDGEPLFDAGFLDFLQAQPAGLGVDIDAMPEGTVCGPHEPMVRVSGPLWACQVLETPLLTILNFQTLIATKAARVCRAAGDRAVLEFGLRRAQGLDGGLSATRAAYVGGVAATSNVEAGRRFGIPVRGTHAHSWVMTFASESEAFSSYAEAMPNNCVFLVDTYDTRTGVARAIEVGERLRAEGHEMIGIRLDSGDLAELSKDARRQLDAAGFPDASVVASNDLDEYRIAALDEAGARIDVFGVGTRLSTAYDQPALGGVYKLGALEDEHGAWRYTLKLSENPIKVSNPGNLSAMRQFGPDGVATGDVLYDLALPPEGPGQELLVPVLRGGARVSPAPTLDAIRAHRVASLATMPEGVLALADPAAYPITLEPRLAARKTRLLEALRDGAR